MHEPLRKSLMQPILLLGCEKNLFLFLIPSLSYGILLGFGRLTSFLGYLIMAVLILSIPVAIYGLRTLAKVDNQFFAVYRKNFNYPRVIRASVSPWVKEGKIYAKSRKI